jgi:transcriptional regulator with XRE-family HTH domain
MEVNVDKLTELRIDHGLTQRELSEKAGLSPSAVWNLERRGSGRPDTLKKIADVLGVRASELVRER